MTFLRYLLTAIVVAAVAIPTFAQEKLPDGTNVSKLEVRPRKVELNGPFGYSQLLITATLDNGEKADVTRFAKIKTPLGVTVTSSGLLRSTIEGEGNISVSLEGQTVEIPVIMKDVKADKPVSSVTDVQPVLGKRRIDCSNTAEKRRKPHNHLVRTDPEWFFRRQRK